MQEVLHENIKIYSQLNHGDFEKNEAVPVKIMVA